MKKMIFAGLLSAVAAVSVFGQSNNAAASVNAAVIEQLIPLIKEAVKEAVKEGLAEFVAAESARNASTSGSSPGKTGALSLTIMSKGSIPKDTMTAFLLSKNPALSRGDADRLAALYMREAEAEGVNYEIAFAQMCYHTNYLSFRAVFAPQSANNFGGISAVYPYTGPYKFKDVQTGIRAHIQHLQAYAGTVSAKNSVVDPRYELVLKQYGRGSAPTIESLAGKWSPANPDYDTDIKAVLAELHAFK